MENNNEQKNLNRRDFITKVGSTAAGIGLASLGLACSDPRGEKASMTNIKEKNKRNTGKNAMMKIIDVHRHCIPGPSAMSNEIIRMMLEKRIQWKEDGKNAVTTINGISSIVYSELMDIDAQIKGQNEAGITKSILSNSMALESTAKALFLVPEDELTRQLNDSIAAMVDKYPDKLDFMATVNPFNKDCIKECERCIDTMGAKGINISTSWDGKYLDSPELNYFWKFVQQRNLAVFLHPPFVPIGHEYMAAYKLEEMIGRGFDTTMTVIRMIYSGVFDRYPKLNIVLPHMGGGLPMFAGRLDFGYRLGYKGLPQDQRPVCKRKPTDYFRTNLYVDTMGFNPLGIKHVIDLFGIDRILFGSDYAAVPINPGEQVDIVKSLGLSREDEEKILWKNADRLFQIS